MARPIWMLLGVLFAVAVIWIAMWWLGGPPECGSSRRIAIGETMLVAGCP